MLGRNNFISKLNAAWQLKDLSSQMFHILCLLALPSH